MVLVHTPRRRTRRSSERADAPRAAGAGAAPPTPMEARPLLSPVWLALTIVSYVGLVLGTPPLLRLLGLRPLKAQALKCVYNFVVSVGSAALCVALLREYFGSELRFICNSGPAPEYLATLLYLFHVSKFAEVCDTLLLLLSHKEAGLFHVYHHATIVMVTWDVTRDGGSDGYFIAAFNTFVHGWMYGYYALASVRWPCPWKPVCHRRSNSELGMC
jgi:fatty acid elongase 3